MAAGRADRPHNLPSAMAGHQTKTLTINTPEGIGFSLILAGPVVRFLAWLVDFLCIMALFSFAGKLISVLQIISQDFFTGFWVLFYFFLTLFYPIFLEWFWNGQTLGKRLFNLRVMDVQGLELQPGQVVIRNLLRAIDIMPAVYMAGGMASAWSAKGQRIGDMIANTIVIRTPTVDRPELSQIRPDKFNSFKSFPHLCARLRQKVPLGISQVALGAILRRNSMAPDARVEVFRQLAIYFKEIQPFPIEATEGLSDEQYLKNMVAILFSIE